MSDQHSSRFSDRGRREYDDSREFRGRDHDAPGSDDYRSRHDGNRSRSPARYSSRGRSQGGRREEPGAAGGSYSNQHAHPHERGRSQRWEQQGHYDSGMYDDGYYGRDQDYVDDRQYEASGQRGRRDSISREPTGRRGSTQSRSRSRDAGKPTDTVILEKLPDGISQSELVNALQQFSVASKLLRIDVRIPGNGRRAFVQFSSTDDAVYFIREHYPKLILELPLSSDENHDGKFSLYPHYARSRDDTESRTATAGSWNCTFCNFSNYATRTRCKKCDATVPGFKGLGDLTGATDAGDDPSYMIVAYPLPTTIDEETFGREIKRLELEKPNPVQGTVAGAPKLKSTAPVGGLAQGSGARPGSLHRVFLMRDVRTNESFNFGFAEFWTREDANQALIRVKNSRGFTIGSSEVNLSRIHLGVFLPEDRRVTAEIERESFYPLINPVLRVRYRDTRVFPCQKVINVESPDAVNTAKSVEVANTDQKKLKKRKAEGIPGASASKKAVPMAGQLAIWQRKHDEIHSGGPTKGSSASLSAANQVPVRNSIPTTIKPNANAPIKFSLPGTIGLATSTESANTLDQKPPEKNDTEHMAAGIRPAASESKPISYVDFENLQCYVCKMRYKSAEDLTIHEKSKNHREASADEAKVRAAMPKVRARDARLKKQMDEEAEEEAGTQYRDRAKERRKMFNRPSKQQPSQSKTDTGEGANISVAAPAAAKPVTQSKAVNMMLKQGWTGEGLGAKGDGRTEVIATNAYQERAGLGAEGGLLGDAAQVAAKNTTDERKGYSKMAQDKARDRYSKMD